jgi:hypothetical protein
VAIEERKSSEQSRPGVCADIIVALALFHRVPVEKRAREGSLLGDSREATEKFGPLKVVLGEIPALYAHREVRSHPSSQTSPLIKTLLTGVCHRGEQD